MNENKKTQCHLKCKTCQHYERETDFCNENKIEDCSKLVVAEFSQCTDYLVREDLVMF